MGSEMCIRDRSKIEYILEYKTKLDPPSFFFKSKRVVAKKDGSILIRFQRPKLANKFQYTLKRGSDEIKTVITEELMFKAENLMPGNYTLEASSFNIKNELGSPNKILISVLDKNNLQKPSIKTLKIRRRN